jgi:fibronectin-binding autotransporter adhesin
MNYFHFSSRARLLTRHSCVTAKPQLAGLAIAPRLVVGGGGFSRIMLRMHGPAQAILRGAGALLAVLALFAFNPQSLLANTEDDVVNGQTDLSAATTYTSNPSLPSTTNDVTFTSTTYSSTAFTLNPNGTNLSIGTLDDLDATQTLTIQNTAAGNTSTITLNGGSNSVAPLTNDLLYVASGGTLNIGGGAGTLNLALAASGNFDIAGASTISSAISGAFSITKTGAGSLTLSGGNIFNGLTISTGTVSTTTATGLDLAASA